MNNLRYVVVLLFSVIFLSPSFAGDPPYCKKAQNIVKIASKYHYMPREIDDQFSKLVYNGFLEMIDPGQVMFSSEDMAELDNYSLLIDDEIYNGRCIFVPVVTGIYKNRLAFLDSIFNSYEVSMFDFNSSDSIVFTSEPDYLSVDELAAKWKKLFHLHLMDAWFDDSDSMEVLPEPGELQALLEEIIVKESCKLRTMYEEAGGIEEYIESTYLSAITNAYDPHTVYLPPSAKTAFDDMLSKQNESFGMTVNKNNRGELIVVHISPGGPAWNSNEVKENDIVESAVINGEEKEFACMTMMEANELIFSPETKSATFRIRKKNGNLKEVKLDKEIILNESNNIMSFILDGEKRLGYIYLPSFYESVDEQGYPYDGCAEDIAKEIYRLEQEKIDGLILDLRNNGGGSMNQAVQLSGMFIDYGAVGIQHFVGEEPVELRDVNRGMAYGGPLLVMINGFSASASEFFAAAMQDHKRAIIVGSPSFGKASMQNILPLEDPDKFYNLQPEEVEEYVKMTTGVFYRLSGESHQRKGVMPDILLPDPFREISNGEDSYESSLLVENLNKSCWYLPFDEFETDSLKKASSLRIDSNRIFQKIDSYALKFAAMQKSSVIPINYKGYSNYLNETSKLFSEFEAADTSLYKVQNLSYLVGFTDYLDAEKELNQNMSNYILKDIYVHESFRIMSDIINNRPIE